MRTRRLTRTLALVSTLAVGLGGCGKSGSGDSGAGGTASTGGAPGSGGTTSPAGGSGGAASGGNTGGRSGSGGSTGTGGAGSGGMTGVGGTSASGGSRATGGTQGTGGTVTQAGTGGASPQGGAGGTRAGTGGTRAGTGGTPAGTGGAPADAAGITEAGTTGGDCTVGTWPTADPSAAGPFATVIENPIGPTAGVGVDGGASPQFTLFRPKDLAQGGLCHPLITWGNGTSANPTMYKVLLNNLASHGFVVIGSNSPNVAQGNPAPMIVGVTWVLQQNDDSTSELYHRIDTTHIGATGHSQGAMATSQAATDSHITTSVPICGAMTEKNLHGPAMFFCGGQDTLVGCSGAQNALTAVTTLPAMFAEYVSADHGSWMSFTGNKPSAVETAITAWMRVHLMGDDSLRSWFYGASCKLCTDSAWIITQKNMDQ